MHTVEFETPIKNGIVQIPKKYQKLQQVPKAKIIVIYEEKNKDAIKSQLNEFRRLRSLSKNKTPVSLDKIINIDEDMINDGIF